MAGMILALSIFVQIVQEVYKYLSKSKSRLYTQVLVDGLGPWAQLLSISSKEIHIRCLAPLSFDIGSREIEISLAKGLTLRTRLARRSKSDLYFEYAGITSDQIKSLNKWLKEQMSAA